MRGLQVAYSPIRDRFVVELAKKVDALFERQDIEIALQREPAPALLSHAMNIASRSFGQEKLEALRNATVSGIFYSPQNVNLTALVFSMLDRLTDGHISMLKEIANLENATDHHVPWERVKMIGVHFMPSPDGMKSPTRTLPINGEDRFIDGLDIQTNEILLADMVSLGLVEQRSESMTAIHEWSTGPSQNLFGYALVTHKGRLVLEYISEAK
ncbi:hypothetical protein [Mesorhizobium shangrilense]|uniref:Uncharacterized protein n=1 Tax=Mesorhizobium shangrilense TaxID=460060 RepID=A0ABV2DNP0_9HYPH